VCAQNGEIRHPYLTDRYFFYQAKALHPAVIARVLFTNLFQKRRLIS
jgi:hypothetical protein